MTSSPIKLDALWKCLCPSFGPHQSLWIRSLGRTSSTIRTTHRLSTQWRAPTRCINRAASTFSRFEYPATHPDQQSNDIPNLRRAQTKPLVHMSTPELYDQLIARSAAGDYEETMNTLKILLKDRKEEPDLRMYSALLRSYADDWQCSAGMIRRTIEEMRAEGIEMDSRACHNILEALAVHPDYILRVEILEYMKERWFTLSDRGHNFVVAGLLRDRCFEQALDKIEAMTAEQIPVSPWVSDMAIYLLLDNKDLEEAYQLVLMRQNSKTKNLSLSLWMQLLDCASKLHHFEIVKYVWNVQVSTSYLKPASGTCMQVLNVAARHSDVELATDVFRVLTERGTAIKAEHYEMLLETYLNSDDLKAALEVLLIMQDSEVRVKEVTVVPLYEYLREDPDRPMKAFEKLQGIEQSGRAVPTPPINSCIQALVSMGRLEDAIEIYKVLHTVSKAGPNTATFNHLFQGCSKEGRFELALFLLKEMLQLKVEADSITYDRLIIIHCQEGKVNDAMLYYAESKEQKLIIRPGTLQVLLKKGLEIQHDMVPQVATELDTIGHLPKEIRQALGPPFDRKPKQSNQGPDKVERGGLLQGKELLNGIEEDALSGIHPLHAQ